MLRVMNLLKRAGKRFFSKEKIFPSLRVYRFLGLSITIDRRKKFRKVPIQNNKVVFWAHFNHFTCNPKYIALALKSLSNDLDIVWVAPSKQVKKEEFPEGVRLVTDLDAAAKEISSAKVFVANQRTQLWLGRGVEKKPGQLFIQTWHGSLGIKKTGADRSDLSEVELAKSELDSSFIDLILSNGRYTTDLYSRVFFQAGKVAEVGLPRNDIFFKNQSSKFKNTFNISSQTKIALFAPTWRERKGQAIEVFDADSILRALEIRFGGSWQLVYRLHHLQKSSVHMNGINVSDYPDIQEIMADADVVITDYSSCIYDFVLTKRPGFIFAPDRDEYDNSRGLYYPLEQTPFPVAETQTSLVQNILSFNNDEYLKKVCLFLEGKGCREDGHASEKVAAFIINYLSTGVQDFNILRHANKL